MTQEIIVLTIIWIAILYTVYQTAKLFLPSKNKTLAKCEGCSGCALKSTQSKIINFPKN